MFVDIDERKEKVNFQKTVFLSTTTGKHTIRILDSKATKHYTHYLNKATVACLGEDCPICLNNKRLIVENPENFRDMKGWATQQQRFFFNVLDRTIMKICPSCKTEVVKEGNSFPPTCPKCGTFVNQVEEAPCNTVKVWSFGVECGGELNSAAKTILEDTELSPTQYDFILNVEGVGKEKKVHPTGMAHRADKVEVPAESLYDLDNATIKLVPEELMQLMRGVSLKDIFTARRSAKPESKAEEAVDVMSENASDDIKVRLEKLFGA